MEQRNELDNEERKRACSDDDNNNNAKSENDNDNEIWATNPNHDLTDSKNVKFVETTLNNNARSLTRNNSEYKVVVATEKKHSLKERPRKRVASKFNSFDYGESENVVFIQRQQSIKPQSIQRLALVRWLMSFLIGLYVAIIAIAVTLCNKYITAAKLAAVYTLIKDCSTPTCLLLPTFVWMVINMALVFVGAYLVTFHAPLAAGSGIPNVKCYLNGIRMPGLMSLRTLLAKAGGVVLSVSGGLACGKEGPMIHSGAICASGLARAEFKCGKKVWKPEACEPLRTDEERRDFVAAGAASGVSAAFGSPVGGVLFSLEEGASFVKQMLTWRMLFSSMTACLVLNFLLSAINGHPEDMSNPGLVSFGHIGDISFRTFELPIFVIMGCIGGLTGAIFVHVNYKITLLRRRFIKNPWLKVAEAIFVAGCSAIIFVLLIYGIPNCEPIRGYTPKKSPLMVNETDDQMTGYHDNHHEMIDDNHPEMTDDNHTDDNHDNHHDLYGYHGAHGYVYQGFCPYGEHNRMADILFKTGEGGLHAMLHAPLDEWHIVPLLVLVVVYHFLATWTYGLSVSSGVFIPSLLIGAIWGRIVGILVMTYITAAGTNIGKYALVGAAANLGGATRMTLSLTVIVIECTGDITFGVPIMLSLIVAKWTGDYFNPGIYDLHIEIQGIPLLPWEPPEMSFSIKASEVMTCPVECLQTTENIQRLQLIINSPTSHNGYPVVIDADDESCPSHQDSDMKGFGRLKGFLLIKDINAIIAKWQCDGCKDMEVDLTPFMDRSPYSVQEDTSLPRMFKIFRGLGLRHLIVVNDYNQVVGIITRVNLARYRGEMHKGNFILEELAIAKD